MNNPWLEISHSDYENHMTEVGQAQVLSNLVKSSLEKYLPQSFALLGCASGNGLEHVKTEITKKVYAIDISQKFLDITRQRFENKINNLEILNIDIQNDELIFEGVDLFFIGLVLEYVEPEKALRKIIRTLSVNGVLFIVIQKNDQTSFVSKTKYKSLEKLTDISNKVNEDEIDKFIHSHGLVLSERTEIELMKGKSFITLEYRMMGKNEPVIG